MDRLLELLQEDGRLSVSQLAVMLNRSEEEIEKTMKGYEKSGVIKGYQALVNWEKSGDNRATALIELRITPKKDTGFDEIATRVMGFSEVKSVYLMSGGYDLAVIVTAKSMSEVAMFVQKRLATIDGVLSTATHFVLTKYKDGGVIFNNEDEEVDERGSNLCD